VAREQEDVISFREIQSELVSYWDWYLAQQVRKKGIMRRGLAKMLDVDVYPSHEWDDINTSTAQSPTTFLEHTEADEDGVTTLEDLRPTQRCCVLAAREQRQLEIFHRAPIDN
jgi:hypothetical protein